VEFGVKHLVVDSVFFDREEGFDVNISFKARERISDIKSTKGSGWTTCGAQTQKQAEVTRRGIVLGKIMGRE
jgi:hypothetical protein